MWRLGALQKSKSGLVDPGSHNKNPAALVAVSTIDLASTEFPVVRWDTDKASPKR